MKIISFANNKGGVGKTTSVQNVGACLAKKDCRVLLVDLDPQASLTRGFGVEYSDIKKDAGDFLLGDVSFEEVVLQSELLWLIPATGKMNAKEDALKNHPSYPFNLKQMLTGVAEHFDFCVIDCPPSLSGYTRISLIASEMYFVPLQAEYLSYEGLANFLEFAKGIQNISQAKLGGVFPTRYNPQAKKILSRDLISSVAEQLGQDFIEKGFIRENISISEAQAMGMNIFDYKSDSNGALDYLKLTNEIVKRVTQNVEV
jgi:chromosome partitioning protein